MGIVSNWVRDILKDKQDKLNSINKDIANLEDTRNNAESASKLFDEASNGMKGLRSDVQSGFNGEAAEAFSNKLLIYCIYCDSRKEHMDKKIKNANKQLQDLNKQKNKSQKSVNRIQSIIDLLKL